MVTVLLDATGLDIVLSRTERVLARRSAEVRIHRDHIRRAQLTDDPWTWLRGVPNPGTLVRHTIAMGTWRSAGGDDFVLVRRRNPAIVIDLDGDPEFQRIVLTTRHGFALMQALHLDGAAEAGELVVADQKKASPRPRRSRTRPALA